MNDSISSSCCVQYSWTSIFFFSSSLPQLIIDDINDNKTTKDIIADVKDMATKSNIPEHEVIGLVSILLLNPSEMKPRRHLDKSVIGDRSTPGWFKWLPQQWRTTKGCALSEIHLGKCALIQYCWTVHQTGSFDCYKTHPSLVSFFHVWPIRPFQSILFTLVVQIWGTIMSIAEWNKKEELVAEQAMKHLRNYTQLFGAFATTQKAEMSLLLKVQEFCYENMNFMKAFQKIVLMFYKSKCSLLTLVAETR